MRTTDSPPAVRSAEFLSYLVPRIAACALMVPLCVGTGRDVPVANNCESCHPAQSQAYAQTRMASAMVPALRSAFARSVETLALKEPSGGYQFVYRKGDGTLRVISFRGTDKAAGTIDWVLGSGAQGQTPIVRSGADFFESRVSFFPQLDQYGITVGQTAEPSRNATAALGRHKTAAELSQCFGCHGVVLDAGFTKIRPGIQCEQCHPGATRHAQGAGMPLNPGKLTSHQQVGFCGNCHRVQSPGDGTELENIRFQPLRLMKSRCFAAGKIGCTTCHLAHQDARRVAAAFYNSRCLTCHTGGMPHTDARATGNCIQCHMPQVQLHPALRFTDHFIRVVSTADYPPGSIVQREGG